MNLGTWEDLIGYLVSWILIGAVFFVCPTLAIISFLRNRYWGMTLWFSKLLKTWLILHIAIFLIVIPFSLNLGHLKGLGLTIAVYTFALGHAFSIIRLILKTHSSIRAKLEPITFFSVSIFLSYLLNPRTFADDLSYYKLVFPTTLITTALIALWRREYAEESDG